MNPELIAARKAMVEARMRKNQLKHELVQASYDYALAAKRVSKLLPQKPAVSMFHRRQAE